MDIKFLEFSRYADKFITDPSVRGKIIGAAVGIAIANKLALPSLQLEVEPSNYFNTQVALGASDLIARFNEEVVFDTRYCREAMRAFWLLRYSAAYPGAQFYVEAKLGFVDSIVGATLYLAPEMHEFCNAHKDEIINLVREGMEIIKATE
jgi:cbb3-type cytochrome oxidase subunit 1